MRIRYFVGLCVALLALDGCAAMKEVMGDSASDAKATDKDVQDAKAAGDFDRLSAICMGQEKAPIAVMDAACEAGVEVLTKRGDMATLEEICQGQGQGKKYNDWRDRGQACDAKGLAVGAQTLALIEKASCEDVIGVFEKHKDELTSRHKLPKEQAHENYVTIGRKIAKCGHWDYTIEKLAHWGQKPKGWGYDLIVAAAEDGADWEKEVLAYVKRHDGPKLFDFEHAYYFLIHYTEWLDQNGKHECKPYIAVAAKTPDEAFGAFNWYFRQSDCKKAAPIIAKRLASDRWKTRMGACESLGKLGTKRKYFKKLDRLAKRDPYYWLMKKDKEGRLLRDPIKVYDVREKCAEAANKLAVK